MRGYGYIEFARDFECPALGEVVAIRHVECHLESEHVAAALNAADNEIAELGFGGPLPGSLLEVAIGQHEPTGYGLQRIHGRIRVLDSLQAMRPIDRRRHAGVERFDRRQQIAGEDVLRTEDFAPLQVVPDEVLGQGPVCAVAAHDRLPHMAVRIDHARHDDSAAGVNFRCRVGDAQVRTDLGDALALHQDVRVAQDAVPVVHGQHGAVAQDNGPAALKLIVVDHLPLSYQTAAHSRHCMCGTVTCVKRLSCVPKRCLTM